MMKKVLYFVLIISCISFISIVNANEDDSDVKLINNNNVSISFQEYECLESLGFNDIQIRNMSREEFNVNKDLTAKVISTDSKYVKVLEYFDINEYENYYNKNFIKQANKENFLSPIYVEEIELSKEQFEKESSNKVDPYNSKLPPQSRSTEIGFAKVSTSYKMLQTQILKISNGKYRARTDLVWLQMPVNRGEDLIKTEVGTNVIPNDKTRYGKQLYTMCSGNDCIEGNQVYSSSSSKWVSDGEFYSRTLQPNLKNNEWIGLKYYSVTVLWIYMYYDLSKDYSGTINVLDSYGEYKHWRPDGYDSMSQPHAQATNVNW